MVAAAVVGGMVVGGYMSSEAQKSSASDAADAQMAASDAATYEKRRQFEAVKKLMSPYVDAGNESLAGQKNLIGLNGTDAQRQAIDALQQGPEFQALLKQGENSILQNASATGGLRGGNTQAALAQFSPSLLSQLIGQQYNRLGGITSLGQNSAAMTGNAGMATANSIGQDLTQAGAAQAGSYLAQGKANAQMYSTLGNAMGAYVGLGGKF